MYKIPETRIYHLMIIRHLYAKTKKINESSLMNAVYLLKNASITLDKYAVDYKVQHFKDIFGIFEICVKLQNQEIRITLSNKQTP